MVKKFVINPKNVTLKNTFSKNFQYMLVHFA